MTSRILVVDDIEANVRLLEAKLTLEYYEVVGAQDGLSGIEVAQSGKTDLIFLDVMMPGIDGFETCRRLKADPRTRDIPVILISALDGREDRIQGLQAGADDFITKPIDDVIMFAKIKSRLRGKSLMDTLRIGRPATVQAAGGPRPGQVVIIDDDERQVESWRSLLGDRNVVVVPEAGRVGGDARADLFIVNGSSGAFDGLRALSQLKSGERTARTPVLMAVDPADRPRLIKALDLGADDLIARPIDPEEAGIRAARLIERKRTMDGLLAPFGAAPALTPSGDPEELAQRPAPHRFSWDGSQIRSAPTLADPSRPEVTEEVLDELRGKVQTALEGLVGNHADPRLERSMEAFKEVISAPAGKVRSGRLLMRYRSLQADVEAYGDPISERDWTVKALVEDVSASASDLIVLYPDLRAIEDARLSLELSSVAGVREELAAIADAAGQSPVVSAEVIEALTEMTAESDAAAFDVPLTLEPSWRRAQEKRSTVSIGLQLLTVRNFCAAALKSISREVGSLAADSAREARAAIPRGVGAGVERVVSGSIVLALVTMVAALAGPLAGLAAMAVTFRPLAERAKKIRDAIEPEAN